jgi:3-deoxy-D-manno-octulosonate 8-phosphate phosphatase (KDO 8-P phosphatase)
VQLVLADCCALLGHYGRGVARLREAGIETAVVTGQRSLSVLLRADQLRVAAFLGVRDKAAHLEQLLDEIDVSVENIAYIGGDLTDLGIIERVADRGLVGAPNDAMPRVIARAHYVARARAGHGAFWEFAEWIVALRPRQHAASAARSASTAVR